MMICLQESLRIAQEPVLKARKSLQVKDQQNTSQEHDCRICYGEMEAKDNIFVLQCGHSFHLDCLSRLLESRYIQNICAVCVKAITRRDEEFIQLQKGKKEKEKKRHGKILLQHLSTFELNTFLDKLVESSHGGQEKRRTSHKEHAQK